jgi:hypothetical protein
MPEPLDDALVLVVALVALAVAAAPPLPVVVVVLLLLPHAASPRARAAKATARGPTGLILPVTTISFRPQRLNGQPYSLGGTVGDFA